MSHGLRVRKVASQFADPGDTSPKAIPWITILSIAFELLRSLIARKMNPAEHAKESIRYAAADCGVSLSPDLEMVAADALVEDLEREPLIFASFSGPGPESFDIERWSAANRVALDDLQARVSRGYGVASSHETGEATDGDLKRVVLDLAAPFGGKFPEELAELARNARTSPEDLRQLCRLCDARVTPPREEPENPTDVRPEPEPAPDAKREPGSPAPAAPDSGSNAGSDSGSGAGSDSEGGSAEVQD